MKYAFSSMLNKPGYHSIAAVSYAVSICEYGKNKGQRDKDTSLHISSCDSSIELQFDWEREGDKSNSLHKIKTLREALDELEKVIKESK